MKRRSVKHRMKKKTNRHLKRIVICLILISVAMGIKTQVRDTKIYTRVKDTIKGSVDIGKAIEVFGRAVSGESEIQEVFKEETPTLNPIEIDMDFYKPNTFEDNEDAQTVTAVHPIDFSAEEKEIELLSFQMSEEELSDDTENTPFVIPPPSNCSYEKYEIHFKTTTPVYGKITSPYGYRDHPVDGDGGFHTGMDIAASKGTTVKAFAKGKVIQASTNKIYGKYVLIEHENGIRSFYGHNSKLCVKTGQSVKLGDKIAEVGTTGLSTGPHLHFEVRNGNTRLNPKYYITPEKG